LHDSKGTGGVGTKKLITVFFKKFEQKGTVMQRHVYHREIRSVDEWKRQLIDVWCGFEQSIFDEDTDQWRVRL